MLPTQPDTPPIPEEEEEEEEEGEGVEVLTPVDPTDDSSTLHSLKYPLEPLDETLKSSPRVKRQSCLESLRTAPRRR